MYHVYSTAITRRYIATRGRALALCGLGMPIGEAAFPVLVILSLSITDWRTIWFILPLFAFFSFAPSIPFLTRRTRFQDGSGRTAYDSPEIPYDTFFCPPAYRYAGQSVLGGYHLANDGAQLYHYGSVLPSNLYSGGKGCAIMALVVKLCLYALATVISAFFSGFLIDRLTAHRVAYVSQILYYFLVYSYGGVMAHIGCQCFLHFLAQAAV